MNSANRRCSSILLSIGMLVSLVACAEDDLPPIRYHTEQAVIGTTFEQSICLSDLAWLDDHIEFIEDFLGASSETPVEIYLYDDFPPQCALDGCYTTDGYVAASWHALDHEVVHAVVDRFADPSAFWSEGIAEALTKRGTYRGWRQTVTDNATASESLEVDYATAGHFVRWLIETRGIEPVRDVLEGVAVDHALDGSLAELEEEYEAEAPYTYPPVRDACDYFDLSAIDVDAWFERIPISCDVEGTSRFEGFWVSAVRTVDLDAGRYELAVTGGKGARIVGCQDRSWPDPPPEMINGDVPNAVENSQTEWGLLFESGRAHVLDLTEGRYKIVLPTWEDEETVEISLRRLD